MASSEPRILHGTIDDGVLRAIYASDQEMYPAPLSFDRLQSWVLACPELSLCFYTDPEGNNSRTDLGAIIALPVIKSWWEQLLVGNLKEPNIDPSVMFPSEATAVVQDVGLHVFHIEKFPGFVQLGKIKHFASFAMNTIREIAGRKQWNIVGYSALTATAAGRSTFGKMGFTSTGYQEAFVRVAADSAESGDVEMVCVYPHERDPEGPSGMGPVLSSSHMTVKHSNDAF